MQRAERVGCNLRQLGPHAVGIALDETTSEADIETLMSLFRATHVRDFADETLDGSAFRIPQSAIRNSKFLTHPVFNTHTRKRRCCAICAGSRRAICRSPAR